jgi:YidC/Oxa1 family membrane protein insertase
MDRRTLLALVLTAIVIVATPILFPSPRQQPRGADSLALTRDSVPARQADSVRAPQTPATAPRTPQPTIGAARPAAPQAPALARVETTTVRTRHAVHRIASMGASPVDVELPEHRSLRPGAAPNTTAHLIEPGDRLFHFWLASETDTIALDTVAFRAAPQRLEGETIVQSFTGAAGATTITLTYRFPADSFVMRIDGSLNLVAGAPSRRLIVGMPRRIRSEEADVPDDTRHLAIAYRAGADEIENVRFNDLTPSEVRADTGRFDWIAARNKYFVVAVAPAPPDSAFRIVAMRGLPRTERDATGASAAAILPLTSPSSFAVRVYAGPQTWEHLRRAAPELDNVNPYGSFIHGIVQPFTTIVMRMILWMRRTLDVSYGWVLVIFGVLVRIVLWPLNQNAMRSSMKLQRLQPELAELQKKYASDPERQREAMLKLYQEHGMSPFSPILGCLPMFLPMPILFALYFVFQNTIELRGVSFWWLPDLSLKDPYYIIPLVMGASMFLMSWIGMRGMPPSPQAKMMAYVMPVMFTVIFWNFASGLNLYYAVQNIASLPQQWLLAHERQKSPGKAPPVLKPAQKRE